MTFEFDSETYTVILGLINGKYSVKLEGEKQDIIIFLSSKEYEILNDSVTEEVEFRIEEYLEAGRGEFRPFVQEVGDETHSDRMEKEFRRREYLADED